MNSPTKLVRLKTTRLVVLFVGLAYGNFLLAQKDQGFGSAKSLMEVHVGTFGAWIQHETKLEQGFVLRTEVGLRNPHVLGNTLLAFTFIDQFLESLDRFVPEINIEPRLYFIEKRKSKENRFGKGRYGHFFSLRFVSRPDWFSIGEPTRNHPYKETLVIPSYGVKRMLVRKLSVEGSLGLAFRRHIHHQNTTREEIFNSTAFQFDIRLGYRLF